MARGINKVILIGNLGADPEKRTTPSGLTICTLRLATSESWKDKNTGEMQERTEWHRIVLFDKLAEIADRYLHKGSQVYLEGRLQTRKWQDQGGQERYTTEIVVSDMQMLGGRAAEAGTEVSTPRREAPATTQGGSFDRTQDRPAPDQFDDDIPF